MEDNARQTVGHLAYLQSQYLLPRFFRNRELAIDFFEKNFIACRRYTSKWRLDAFLEIESPLIQWQGERLPAIR